MFMYWDQKATTKWKNAQGTQGICAVSNNYCSQSFLALCKDCYIYLDKSNSIFNKQPVHVPRRNRKRRRKTKLWFVLELMHEKQTYPSMYHSTEAWFVRHMLYPEPSKTFIFWFVFARQTAFFRHFRVTKFRKPFKRIMKPLHLL